MRFLYKRPGIRNIRSELDLVMDVLMSDIFIVMDLFWFSLIFTIFLIPFMPSLIADLLFLGGSYLIFLLLYFFVFRKSKKKSIDV